MIHFIIGKVLMRINNLISVTLVVLSMCLSDAVLADSYVVGFHNTTNSNNKAEQKKLLQRVLPKIMVANNNPDNDLDESLVTQFQQKNCYNTLTNACRFDLSNAQLQQFKALDFVKYVLPDYETTSFLDHSRPLIGAVDLEFSTGVTGAGVSIAILDTGIDYQHQAFGSCSGVGAIGCKVIAGYDFINDDADPLDDNGHGTHVAGIVSGNGLGSTGNSMKGIAPQSNLMVYKVLNQSGSGNLSQLLMALEYALDPNQDGDFSDRADIVNLSLGFNNVIKIEPLDESLDNLNALGVLIIAAAGNSGPKKFSVYSPASNQSTLAVAASTHLPLSQDSGSPDQKASYSSIGGVENAYHGEKLKPEIIAPGGDIHTGDLGAFVSGIGSVLSDTIYLGTGLHLNPINDYYSRLSGTSMAAPHVAGAAALLIELYPGITTSELKSRLMLGAVDLGYLPSEQGAGRLQIDVSADFPLVTTPQIIDFGDITSSVNKTLHVKNVSTMPITFSLDTVSDELNTISISPTGPVILQPGASLDMTINFSLNHEVSERELYANKLLITSGTFTGDIPYSYYLASSSDETVGQFSKGPGDIVSIIQEEEAVIDLIDYDYDNDGDIDFITVVKDGVFVYENTSSGYDKKVLYSGYFSNTSESGGNKIYDLDLGDFDGDGKQDIAMITDDFHSPSIVKLLINRVGIDVPSEDISIAIPEMGIVSYELANGDMIKNLHLYQNGTIRFRLDKEIENECKSFECIFEYEADDVSQGDMVYLADYQFEVLSIDAIARSVAFRINKSPFETTPMKRFNSFMKSISFIDGNDDGLLDVVIDGTSNPPPLSYYLTASILINSGRMSFSEERLLVNTSYDDPDYGTAFNLYKTKMIDVTNDGHPDIVGFVYEQFTGEPIQDHYALTYFENNGDFTFDSTPHVLVRRGEHLSDFVKYNHRFNGDYVIDDFDNDGLIEIIISDASALVEYFQLDATNTTSEGIIFDFGQGTQTTLDIFTINDYNVPLVSIDWNDDGYKDLLLVSQHNDDFLSSTHLLINNGFTGIDLIYHDGFEGGQ